MIRAFVRAVAREVRRLLALDARLAPGPAVAAAAQDLDAYRLRRCAAGCAVIWYGPSQRCRSCDGPAVAVEPGEIGRCPEPEQMPRWQAVQDWLAVPSEDPRPWRTAPTPWLTNRGRADAADAAVYTAGPSVAAQRAAAGLPGSWSTVGPVCLCGGHPVVRGEVRR